MANGTITFTAPVPRLRLEQTEIADSHPKIEKIVIEAEDDKRLMIVFHLTEVFSEEDAVAITKDKLDSIINRLAFKLDLSIGEPHLRGFTLPKNDVPGSAQTVVVNRHAMWAVAPPITELNTTRRQELASLLEKQPLTRPDLYSAYRFALNQSDAVARFMFLYNILLQICGDDQGKVDDFIRREIPNVAQRQSPYHNRGIKETVYTRLRNEVGHRRAGTYPEQTRTEIEGNVASFQALVKKAITDAK